MLARLCRACWPKKYFPAPLAGLQCRPLQAKGKAYAKILLLFQNFIVGARIARPPKPCGITRPPGGAEPHPYYKPQESAFKFYRYFAISPYWRALLARLCRISKPQNIPPHRCGPAMQAPTSKRQSLCKNSIALSKFHRRGEHCSPAKALRYHKAPGGAEPHPYYKPRESAFEFHRIGAKTPALLFGWQTAGAAPGFSL